MYFSFFLYIGFLGVVTCFMGRTGGDRNSGLGEGETSFAPSWETLLDGGGDPQQQNLPFLGPGTAAAAP